MTRRLVQDKKTRIPEHTTVPQMRFLLLLLPFSRPSYIPLRPEEILPAQFVL